MPHLPEVEETGATFEENAIVKALAATAHSGALVVADDSGLEVDALNGAPGVHSARFAGPHATDAANVAKLRKDLSGLGEGFDRSARFCCVLAVAQKGELLATFVGAVEGQIATSVSGSGGFGYDPVFVPEGFTQSFAQLGAESKNAISHRAKALEKLRAYLPSSTPAVE
jgi:XTP/dITP diphosphohydrolase